MFVIAYLPPLWYRVMDHRLLAVVGRDPARINFHPGQRERLLRRHRLESEA
jgi:alkane 1-monooxygenase